MTYHQLSLWRVRGGGRLQVAKMMLNLTPSKIATDLGLDNDSELLFIELLVNRITSYWTQIRETNTICRGLHAKK